MACWLLLKLFRRTPTCHLYCDDAFDALLFKSIQKHLNTTITLVAKNKKVQNSLKQQGFSALLYPTYPDMIIMFRNMAWKFPSHRIIRIGFEHGAYNFKRFSKAHYYNLFTRFFMTSEQDVSRAKARGIRTAQAIGFPKIDPAFDGSITPKELSALAARIDLDPQKKTVLLSSTWDGSGMSAIGMWYKRVGELAAKYNLLVTVHSWMSEQYQAPLQGNPHVFFITDYEILRYIMLADCCIGDTNSLIAEFCMLDKPIVTFRLPPTSRTMPDVIELIENVSLRVDTFEELGPAIEHALKEPAELAASRRKATTILLGNPDGLAGKRAADALIALMPELKPNKA